MVQKVRRKLIIEKNFQLKYAGVFALTCFLLGALAVGAIIVFSRSYYSELARAGAFLTPTLAKIYEGGWSRLCWLLGGITVFYSVAAFYAGLVITRNIVGPVMAFRRRVNHLLNSQPGESPQFDLRTSDELQVLKDVYVEIAQHTGKQLKKSG